MTSAFSWQNSISLSCFILYSKGKFACYSRCFLTSYFCIPVPYNEKDIFLGLVLKGLVGLHRTVQLQLLQRYWLGHRLGLLWYWMVCLGNEQEIYFTLYSLYFTLYSLSIVNILLHLFFPLFLCLCLSLSQFSSVAKLCPTLCDPMDCSMPGFPVHHQLPELA